MLLSFIRFFNNPLVLILVAASTVSISLGDRVGGGAIIAMVLLSVLLNFFMEFQARHAVEEIRKQVATMAAVLRDGREQELPIAGRAAFSEGGTDQDPKIVTGAAAGVGPAPKTW